MKRAFFTLGAIFALTGCPQMAALPDSGEHDHDAGAVSDAGTSDAGISDAGAADAGDELPLEADLLPPTVFPQDLLPPGEALPASLLPPRR